MRKSDSHCIVGDVDESCDKITTLEGIHPRLLLCKKKQVRTHEHDLNIEHRDNLNIEN